MLRPTLFAMASSLFGLAIADVETYSQSAALAINRTGSFSTSVFTPNFIPKFDEGGTRSLTSVSEFFSTSTSLSITGTWNSASGNQTLTVNTTDSLSFANLAPSFNDSLSRQVNLVAGSFYSFTYTLGGGRSTIPPDFTPFLGNGAVTPSAVWSRTIGLSPNFNGFINLQISGNATATNRVDYNYEVVPEPGTLMLLGFGTVALAYRKRNTPHR